MSEAFDLGKPGLPPAAVSARLLEIARIALDYVPEEQRGAVAAEMAARIVARRGKPAEAGESILFGEAADEAMDELVRDIARNLRREYGPPDR